MYYLIKNINTVEIREPPVDPYSKWILILKLHFLYERQRIDKTRVKSKELSRFKPNRSNLEDFKSENKKCVDQWNKVQQAERPAIQPMSGRGASREFLELY